LATKFPKSPIKVCFLAMPRLAELSAEGNYDIRRSHREAIKFKPRKAGREREKGFNGTNCMPLRH
jgi:hypothetical protein